MDFRYIFILHQPLYSRLYTRTTVALMLAGGWLYGLFVILATVQGWGSVGYRAAAALCCYDHTASLGHLVFLSVMAINTQ